MLTCPKEMPIPHPMVALLHLLPREATQFPDWGIVIDQTAFKIPEYAGVLQAKAKGLQENPEQEGQLPNIDLHRPELKKSSSPPHSIVFLVTTPAATHDLEAQGPRKPKAVVQLPEEGLHAPDRQQSTIWLMELKIKRPNQKGNWSEHSASFASH